MFQHLIVYFVRTCSRIMGFTNGVEASVAERLSYPLCKPGNMSLILGFSSLSDETLNRGPVSV